MDGSAKKGKTGLKCKTAFWHFGLQRKENCTTISILLVARKQLPWSLLYSPSFQISFSNFIKPIHQRKRWKANERIWTKTTIWDVPSVSDWIKSFGRGKVLNSCYSSHWRLRWKIFQMGKKNSQGRGGKKKGGEINKVSHVCHTRITLCDLTFHAPRAGCELCGQPISQ